MKTWICPCSEEKYEAVIKEIKIAHSKKQPVLVGTTSIEKSELISKMLKKSGVFSIVKSR